MNAFLPAAALAKSFVPEPDEQVRAEADALPADEEDREVVREDEHEHREDEEVQVGEEAPVPFLLLHVSDAVDVDERAHERDERQHEGRESVEAERDVHRVVARDHPRVDLLHDRREAFRSVHRAEHVRDEGREGQHGGEAHRADAHDAVEEPLGVGQGRERMVGAAPFGAARARDQRDEAVQEEAREREDGE